MEHEQVETQRLSTALGRSQEQAERQEWTNDRNETNIKPGNIPKTFQFFIFALACSAASLTVLCSTGDTPEGIHITTLGRAIRLKFIFLILSNYMLFFI